MQLNHKCSYINVPEHFCYAEIAFTGMKASDYEFDASNFAARSD